MLIGDILRDALDRDAGRLAAVDGRVSLSYGELERRTNGLAHALRERGVRPGDRVGMLLGTSVAFLEVYVGAAKAGAVAVPMSTRSSAAEVEFLTGHAGCSLLIHEPHLEASVAGVDVPAIAAGDPLDALLTPADAPPTVTWSEHEDGALFYTSGTTGDPKGVRLSQAGVMWCAQTVRATYAVGPDDVALCQLPLSHVTVHFVPFPLLLAGGTIVLDDGFDSERAFTWMDAYQPTIWVSVTATATLLVKHAVAHPGRYRLERLRKVLTGGSHVPGSLLGAWRELAPNATTVNCYGMTEMASAITRLDPDVMLERPGSVGLPYPGVELRIGDGAGPGETGEVFVRAPSMMAGYWANPRATEATLVDGWLRTGDMGYRDEDGYLYLVGRRSQRLKRGGETVFPGEVEAVIAALDGVKEVAVVGRHDDVMGDRIVAVVALQPGAAVTPDELVAACRERLAGFKVPEYVAILDGDLPKNATGKIDTHGLDRMANTGALELTDLRRGSVRRA